ncbi:phosphate acyltransferase PlsX [Kushneria aurantia]|uniref:Phosphate acyltransferase n=1 Tax=Kushneria aurantia TaxID=504092 RepID=A0ABV6G838_9GAMM|nr:phosphate acyltransferase PlsX [Kushneria aurantia]
MSPLRIAIDAMGGDYGPRATVRGTAAALSERRELVATLYGRRHLLDVELSRLPSSLSSARHRIAIVEAGDSVSAEMTPSSVLRSSRMTSMRASLDALCRGDAHACVSAGNTGALMALARRDIGMLEGIERPAISGKIPNASRGPCYMLDLGANVDCRPAHLVDFAFMGARMVQLIDGVANPRVGLLNVGVESIKGERRVREADRLLRERVPLPFDYRGNIEGDDVFTGDIEVAVCDGMAGNIALKSSEGLARMLGQRLRDEFQRGFYARLVGLLARPVLRRFLQELSPVRYNGASFLGLRSTVVKSHGGARWKGFAWAVKRAADEARQALPQRLMLSSSEHGGEGSIGS